MQNYTINPYGRRERSGEKGRIEEIKPSSRNFLPCSKVPYENTEFQKEEEEH